MVDRAAPRALIEAGRRSQFAKQNKKEKEKEKNRKKREIPGEKRIKEK